VRRMLAVMGFEEALPSALRWRSEEAE
jgi:hypothetical protein